MAKPKPSKYSRARIRSKVRRPKRGGSSRGWLLATIGIAVVGTLLVVLSYNDRQDEAAVGPIANKDHWHAYLGVNICGTWEPAVPQFEGRDGSMTPNPQAGIHSHADYLIHDHPYASDESGKKATLGRYLGYAQSSVSVRARSSSGPPGSPNVDYSNGDKCKSSGQARAPVLEGRQARRAVAGEAASRATRPTTTSRTARSSPSTSSRRARRSSSRRAPTRR